MVDFIEVIGLPGAGKTTFFNQLIEQRGADLPEIHEPLDPGGLAVVLHGIILLARLLVRAPIAFTQLMFRQDGRWLLGKLSYRIASTKKREVDGLMIDAGVLQPLISYLAEYSGEEASIKPVYALLRVIDLPKAVIFADCGAEVGFDRYNTRQQATNRRPDVKVTLEKYRLANEMCNRVVDLFPSTNVYSLDMKYTPNNCSIDSVVEFMRLKIKKVKKL